MIKRYEICCGSDNKWRIHDRKERKSIGPFDTHEEAVKTLREHVEKKREHMKRTNKWYREVAEITDRLRDIYERFYKETREASNGKFDRVIHQRAMEFDRALAVLDELLNRLEEIKEKQPSK
jgi:hypothetical protein